MTKIGFENIDLNDSRSINISVYKPDGISSFWKWFTRKNKNSNLPDGVFDKNYKLKLNIDDLNAFKKNGIDILKHQSSSKSNNKKSTCKNNVFMIPKHQFGLKEKEFLNDFIVPNLKKKHNSFGLNSSTLYKNRVVSTSTISIKSKQSIVCPDLKYDHTIKSKRSVVNSTVGSKASFKVGMKSNTNIHGQVKPLNRNVLLKSVPTAILKSNTQKNKVFIPMYLGRRKTDKVTKFHQMKSQENCTNHQHVKDEASVIPFLLTKIKSMEEQLSDIETTTKKINEVVSQKNILKELSSHDIKGTEKNVQSVTKSIATHKIYSKNLHSPRKSKQSPTKNLKNKNKYTITSINSFKDNIQNHDFNFRFANGAHNGIGSIADKEHFKNDVRSPEVLIKHHHLPLSTNIYKKGFYTTNPDVGSDIFLGLINALTKNNASTKTDLTLHTENHEVEQCLKNRNNVCNSKLSEFISKPTFEWKHKSFSSVSNLQMVDKPTNKFKEESDAFKLQKNNSSPHENHSLNKYSPKEKRLIGDNKLMNTKLAENIIYERIEKEMHFIPYALTKKDCEKAETLDKTTNIEKKLAETDSIKEPHHNEEIQTTIVVNDICRSKHEENIRNCNQNGIGMDVYPNQFPLLKCDVVTPETCIDLCQSDENNLVKSTILKSNDVTNTFDESFGLKSCAEESFMQLCQDLPAISVQSGEICSVSIKQSKVSGFIKPSENLLKRTTLYSSDTEKEPKLSIMILVEDHLKDEVKISNNIITNVEKSVVEYGQTCSKNFRPDSNNLESHGNPKYNVSVQNIGTKCYLDYSNSTALHKSNKEPGLISNYASKNYSRPSKKRNFCCEVNNVEQTDMIENLPFIGKGGYLNQEKRKAFEELLLRVKGEKKEVTSRLNTTPIAKSCTDVKNIVKSAKYLSESSLTGREPTSNKTKSKIIKKSQFSFSVLQEPENNYRGTSINTGCLSSKDDFYASDKNIYSKWSAQKNDFKNLAEINNLRDTSQNTNIQYIEIESNVSPFINKTKSFDHNINVDPKERAYGIGLTLNDEPIVEESEDEMPFQQMNFSHQQTEVGDNIKIQTKHDNIRTAVCKMEDKDPKIGVSSKFNSDKGKREPTSMCVPVVNSVQSSVSVQTDWSLIGFLDNHVQINSTAEQNYRSKKTVSSQTEVKMKQVALIDQQIPEIPIFCKSCMNESQVKKLVPVSDDANNKELACLQVFDQDCQRSLTIDLVEDNVTEVKMSGVLVAVIQDKDKNIVESISHGKTVKYELDNIMKTHFQNLIETPAQFSHNPEKEMIQDVSTNVQKENGGHSYETETFHFCSIPCFPSISEENLFSEFSESKLRTFNSSKVLPESDSAFSQAQKINNGCMNYYSNKLDKLSLSNMSKINTTMDQNRMTNSNSLCGIILDSNDQQDQDTVSDITPRSNIGFNESCMNTKYPINDTPKLSYCVVSKHNDPTNTDGIYLARKGYADTLPNKTDKIRTIVMAEENTTMKSHCSICNKKAESSVFSQKQKVSRDSIVNYVYSIEYDRVQKRGNSCFLYK